MSLAFHQLLEGSFERHCVHQCSTKLAPLHKRAWLLQPSQMLCWALVDYISEGVIAQEVGFSRDSIRQNIDNWQQAGTSVCRSLEFQEEDLDTVQRQRVFQYYLPIFFWALAQLDQHRRGGNKGPLVVCIRTCSTLHALLLAPCAANSAHCSCLKVRLCRTHLPEWATACAS